METNLKLEYNYWEIKKPCDGGFQYIYEKTAVWQTMPFDAVEISETEYKQKLNQPSNNL